MTFDLEVKAVPDRGLDLTTPSSPTDDDLALMKSQGAIPKKMRAKSSGPAQSANSTKQEGSGVKGEIYCNLIYSGVSDSDLWLMIADCDGI